MGEDSGKTTLVGIVSGGLGCGNGYPNWYTRVSFYRDWIGCVLDASRKVPQQAKEEVEVACRHSVKPLPLCEDLLHEDKLFGGSKAGKTCQQEQNKIMDKN